MWYPSPGTGLSVATITKQRLTAREETSRAAYRVSITIIRDMGFSTTMTTQLKSVGDAVQIVALLIGGIIILNVYPTVNTRLSL